MRSGGGRAGDGGSPFTRTGEPALRWIRRGDLLVHPRRTAAHPSQGGTDAGRRARRHTRTHAQEPPGSHAPALPGPRPPPRVIGPHRWDRQPRHRIQPSRPRGRAGPVPALSRAARGVPAQLRRAPRCLAAQPVRGCVRRSHRPAVRRLRAGRSPARQPGTPWALPRQHALHAPAADRQPDGPVEAEQGLSALLDAMPRLRWADGFRPTVTGLLTRGPRTLLVRPG